MGDTEVNPDDLTAAGAVEALDPDPEEERAELLGEFAAKLGELERRADALDTEKSIASVEKCLGRFRLELDDHKKAILALVAEDAKRKLPPRPPSFGQVLVECIAVAAISAGCALLLYRLVVQAVLEADEILREGGPA